jgi:tetratricopeptide (TPR) repeat protein
MCATRKLRESEVIFQMLPCNRYWSAIIACCLLITGCRTSLPAKKKSHSVPHGATSSASEAALQKLAEAHAHYAAGVIEEVAERPDAALKEYHQAALRDPENEALVLEVARRFLQNKQPENALELLARASARPNASAAIFARLGFVYVQLGKFDEAVAASRTAIKKAPGVLAGYQNLFLTYLQNKHPLEAAKVLEEAGRQNKTDSEFLMGLAELYIHLGMQEPAQRKETFARAITLLNQVEKHETMNSTLRLKLAEDYNNVGDSDKAAELYQELLKTMPELPGLRERVRARLAEIYLRGSDRKKATQELEKIIGEDPTNPQLYYSLAQLALEEKQPEKAADYLSKAILLNPDAAPAYAELARIQISLKKTSDALATLDRARAKFPQNFLLEYLSGVAFSQQKAFPEAIQHFTSAEVIAQATHPQWLDEHFYFDLGAVHERKGDYTEAEKYFEKCLQLAPEFAEALNYLGYMWAEKGLHLPRSRELIEKALKLEPKNPAYLDSFAWVLFKLEEPKKALDYILKAVEFSEEADATLYDHLGDIYVAVHQPDKAREAWQKSLAVEANEVIRKKLQDLGH